MEKIIRKFFNNEKRYLEARELNNLKISDIPDQITEDEKNGFSSFNSFFRLWEEAIYLESEIEKNKNELAYVYFLMSYHLCMWSNPPNQEVFGQNLIQKAIDLKPDDGKLELYRVWSRGREMTENWEGIDFEEHEQRNQEIWDKFVNN